MRTAAAPPRSQLNKAAHEDYGGVSQASANSALLWDIVDVGRGSISDMFNQLHMLFSVEYHRFPFGGDGRPRPASSIRALQGLAGSMLHCLQLCIEFETIQVKIVRWRKIEHQCIRKVIFEAQL